MDRTALQVAVLAVICVIAIALAAGALTAPVEVDRGDGDGGGGGLDGLFESDETDDGTLLPGEEETDDVGFGISALERLCHPQAADPGLLGLLVLVYLAIGAVLTRLYNLGVGAVAFVILGTITVIVVPLLLVGCDGGGASFELPLSGDSVSVAPEGGEETADQGSETVTTPSIILVALLFVTLIGLLAALYVGEMSDSDDPEEVPPEAELQDGPAKLASVAGRTADEIDAAADVENAVYRAWAEMTQTLSVTDPETTTPGEFATAAVDAGMNPDDVRELTRLFEEVRYGDVAVTPQREQQAIETLRRIEQTYGGDNE